MRQIIFKSITVNLAIAGVLHVVLPILAIYIFFLPSTPEEWIVRFMIMGIPIGLLIATLEKVPIGHLGMVAWFGSRTETIIKDGWCWLPLKGLFYTLVTFDATEKSTECPPMKVTTKETLKEGSVQVTASGIDIQWKPDGVGYLYVDQTNLLKGLIGYGLGRVRGKLADSSWREIQRADSNFETELLGDLNDPNSEIRTLEKRWCIKIFRINIAEVDMSATFNEAVERSAIEQEEHKAEDIEMKHAGNMVKDFATILHDSGNGMPMADALKFAQSFYQNQVDKTTGININGNAGDFAIGAAINAASGRSQS